MAAPPPIRGARHAAPIPPTGGVGLKREHHAAILATRPAIGWFELHAENYMGAGGPPLAALDAIRRDYPLSVHGVGLNLGGADALDQAHLDRLGRLVERCDPGLVSEHLAWTAHDNAYLNDLLPLPCDEATLRHFIPRVAETQDRLGRILLIENPARYFPVHPSAADPFAEIDFLAALTNATGCGLLLDLANIVVSSANLGFAPEDYLDRCACLPIGELHLSGHATVTLEGHGLLIDDHGSAVPAAVWDLHRRALRLLGPRPTLVEWDNNVPDCAILAAEAAHADAIIAEAAHDHAA